MGVCFNKNEKRVVKNKNENSDASNSQRKISNQLSKRLEEEKINSPKKEENLNLNKIENSSKKNTAREGYLFTCDNDQKINTSNTKRVNESQGYFSPAKDLRWSQTAKFEKTHENVKTEENYNLNNLNQLIPAQENYRTNNVLNDTLEKLINSNLNNSGVFEETEDMTLKFSPIQNEPLFNLVDLYVTTNSEYSTDNDWNSILKKAKHQNKTNLAIKILGLKERRWNKENIILSDIIKEHRENLDSFILTKYLNLRLKLQEHFNWLIWAISYYYNSLLLSEQNNGRGSFFNSDEFGFPPVDSLDWLRGFEWKGIFIRVQTEEQSKNLYQEMKCLNYLFFEYVQLIDTYKFSDDEGKQNLLSSEIIFPLISYANVLSIVIMGSVCINKYNYEDEKPAFITERVDQTSIKQNLMGNYFTFDKKNTNINTVSADNPFVRYNPKKSPNNFHNESAKSSFVNNMNIKRSPQHKPINHLYSSVQIQKMKNLPQTSEYHTERRDKELIVPQSNEKSIHNAMNAMNYDISHIENNSSHSVNITQNINKDIHLDNYSREDLKESLIFSRLESRHLIKVIDDLNDFNPYMSYNVNVSEANYNFQQASVPKFKFMIISARELIPDLVKFDLPERNQFLFVEEKENGEVIDYNMENFTNKLSEKFRIEIKNLENKNASNLGVNLIEKILNSNSPCNLQGSLHDYRYKIFYTVKSPNIGNSSEIKNVRINDIVSIHAKQISQTLSSNPLLNNFTSTKQLGLKNLLIDSKNLEVYGKSVILFSLSSNIKLKYSLIKNSKFSKLQEIYTDFANKTNYLNLIDKFSKLLDVNFAINNYTSLKEYFHRYGVNTSLEVFILPKIRNPKISDMIKMNILCKLIKQFLHFHEGNNFLLKLNLINVNNQVNSTRYVSEYSNIMNEGFFSFIEEKSIFNIYKMKVYHIILSVLQSEKSKQEFVNFFYENLNLNLFLKKLKWKSIDEILNFNLFSDKNPSGEVFNQENFLLDLISTARKRPLMFIQSLEHHLNLIIDPVVKFKSSIALEQFLFHFNETYIYESEPKITSYIKPKELSYYLFTKCLYTSRTSTKYDIFQNKFFNKEIENEHERRTFRNTFKTNMLGQNQYKSNPIEKVRNNYGNTNILSNAKIIGSSPIIPSINSLIPFENFELNSGPNYQTFKKEKKIHDVSIGKLNNCPKVNSNNITKINMINNRYVDSSFKERDSQLNLSNHSGHSLQSASKNVKNEDLSNLEEASKINLEDPQGHQRHQQHFQTEYKENENFNEDLFNSKGKVWDNLASEMDLSLPPILYKLHFKFDDKNSKRNINKFLRREYYFNKIETIKDWKSSLEMLLSDIVTIYSEESVIIQSYIYLFINNFYIENDIVMCREIINKIKDIMKNLLCYKLELLATVNLLEGLVTERKNYIECEEFYSKSLIFSLLSFGDPRGRGNFGNNYLLFPLWKIARQTCILENSLTNESFKEMFHCQDYLFKHLIETSGSSQVNGNGMNNSSKSKSNINNFYDANLNYVENRREILNKLREKNKDEKNEDKLKSPTINKKKISQKLSLSDIVFDEDINEEQSINGDDKNIHISDRNFDSSYKFKPFPFPSISDVRTSYQSYFISENFLLFLLKNMINISSSKIAYDEDLLNRIGLNCYSLISAIEMIQKDKPRLQTTGSVRSTISRKDRGVIFSHYMYEYLLDKLSYKKNPPNSIVMAWGNNSHNETTHINYDSLSLPRVCYKLKDEEILKLSCGWDYNIVINKNQKLFSWGNNESGQCGIGEVSSQKNQPVLNPTLIENLEKIKYVACGNEHSLALMNNGDVYSWGKSEDGVLGYIEKPIEFTPKKLNSLKSIVAISSGSIHNMALDIEGLVYSWGCSKGGQLGHPDNFFLNIKDFPGYLTIPSPIQALTNIKIKKISCGEAHSIALDNSGKVYGWGFTSNGQLGIGICEDSFEPGQGMIRCRINLPQVIEMEGNKVIDVQCGKTFSTFITDRYEIYVCGVNDLNQLGIEQPESMDHIYRKEDAYFNRCCDVVVPTPIESFLNMKVRKVSCGESHCLALVEDMSNKVTSLWSWGSNRFGQLGQGSQIKKSMPKPINYMLSYTSSQVVEIGCGAFHSLCVMSNPFIDKNSSIKDFSNLKQLIFSVSRKWNKN